MARMVDKTVGALRLVGCSIGGVETVVAVPELNVCFDVGRAPSEIIPIDNVCLSHGHMDHAAGVAYYLSHRTFVGISPGRVIAPLPLARHLQALMEVWSNLEGHPSPGEILGVEPGQDVQIRRGLLVRPFAVNHGMHALGYSVIEVRHKLKPEYHNLSGPQLVALKKKGHTIEHRHEMPLVTYCGDTALGRFLDDPCVKQAQMLLIECTFYERQHVSRARAGRHIHVSDLPEVLERVEAEHVVITHVTQRTDRNLVRRILKESLSDAALERVSFLMDRPQGARRNHAPSIAGAADRAAAAS